MLTRGRHCSAVLAQLEKEKAAAEERYTAMYDRMRYKLECSEKRLLEARHDIERL